MKDRKDVAYRILMYLVHNKETCKSLSMQPVTNL